MLLPRWGWTLIFFGLGGVGAVLYFSVTELIFGKYASLKPFDLIARWYDEVAYYPYRLYRRRRFRQWQREAEAGESGETPADNVWEDPSGSDEAESAPAGRRPEGD